jgi:hypothetical protein
VEGGKRGFRRQQKDAAKQKMRKKLARERLVESGYYPDKDDRIVGIRSKTPKACTCWQCGNPRKYLKQVTRPELLASLDED